MVSLSNFFPKKFVLFFNKNSTIFLVLLNKQLFYSQNVKALAPLLGSQGPSRSSKALRFGFFVLKRFGLAESPFTSVSLKV